MLRVFVGFDERETVAYHVLCNSILRQSSVPVCFIPVNRKNIKAFERPREGSTDFSFSRFLVPWLCNYEGHAIFMDCDMLVRCDIAELIKFIDIFKTVSVVKHDYKTKHSSKFLGNKNEDYPCKNWSSLMIFNNHHCKTLTPSVVNTASGAYLHRFEWCGLDQVGSIPVEYNHLVGELEPNSNAKIVHYTLGTPCFKEYSDCEFADEWRYELGHVNTPTGLGI